MSDDQFRQLCNVYGFAPSRALRELIDCVRALVAATTKEQCAQIVQSYMDEAYIGDEGWNVARDILNDIQGKK